jgi:hypothetical protein
VNENYVHDEEEVEEEYVEVDEDEEGEGMMEARTSRQAKYTTDEDMVLCKTWLQIGRDPSVTEQTTDAFWKKMKEHFDANTKGVHRTSRSLRSRWSVIMKAQNNGMSIPGGFGSMGGQ